jgi:hypothetical protein
MELQCKTMVKKIIRRNTVPLPSSFIEENGLEKMSTVNVMYGKNYQCVIIIPTGVTLGSIMKERINRLVTEPLSTER